MASAAAPPRRPAPNPNGDARRDRRVRKKTRKRAREGARRVWWRTHAVGAPAFRAPGPRRALGGGAARRASARACGWRSRASRATRVVGAPPRRDGTSRGVETWCWAADPRGVRLRPAPRRASDPPRGGRVLGTRRPRRRRSRRTGTTTVTGAWTRRRTGRRRRRALLRRRPSPRPACRSLPREGYPSDDPAWPPTAYLGDEDAACRATAARGDGGHVLVLPRLDGDATPGWFVLDTASPGYAIDPAAADALGASSFGRLSVVGVGAAALAGKLRRGSSVGLGACVVSYPTYMEQALRAALNASVAGSVDGGTDRARRRPRDGFSATLRVGDSRAETRAGEPDPAAVRGVREKSTNVRCVPARGGVVATRDVDIRSAARAREGRRRRRRACRARRPRRNPRPGTATTRAGSTGGSSDCPSARGGRVRSSPRERRRNGT